MGMDQYQKNGTNYPQLCCFGTSCVALWSMVAASFLKNVDLSFMRPTGIKLKIISQEMQKMVVTEVLNKFHI